tara:strand:+ start:2649 stop:2777 length:129 start_codon:yes stop_codon:yes gene_type:complete
VEEKDELIGKQKHLASQFVDNAIKKRFLIELVQIAVITEEDP